MTKPTIFFCPKKDAFDLQMATGIFYMAPSRQQDGLNELNQGRSIIVDECVELMGWSAPEGTLIVFIEGFPTDGRIRGQAEGRVRRVCSIPPQEDNQDVKLIELIDRNNLFHKTDGITRFMIRGSGTIDANDLRLIADELDRRNAK